MARPIWSGAISFGLVNIPVKLIPAVRDRTVHFHMLTKDGRCRVRRKLVCPDTGEEVEYTETSRGYEIAPDQYVVLTDEELAAAKPEAARTIEIKDFVDLREIDPIYYERAYYLAPNENGAKAYRLLHDAMARAKKVAIATFVMRQKEYLAAIRPLEEALCLETMHFADEVTPARGVPGLPEAVKVGGKELEVAQRLIEALSGEFRPEKYRDEYRDRLMEMIERKAEGEEVVVQPAREEPARVINLMKALEQSLAEARKTQQPKRPRKKSA